MANARKRLTAAWNEIRKSFFPHWDRNQQWRVRIGAPGKLAGLCDLETKTIHVAKVDDPDDLHLVLIHEICHAVGGLGHGKLWQRRMMKAVERARELNLQNLAKMLTDEIETFDNQMPRQAIYDNIADWARENPDLTYERIQDKLASDFGITHARFDKFYRRAKKVYEEAKQEQELYTGEARRKQ